MACRSAELLRTCYVLKLAEVEVEEVEVAEVGVEEVEVEEVEEVEVTEVIVEGVEAQTPGRIYLLEAHRSASKFRRRMLESALFFGGPFGLQPPSFCCMNL